MALLVPEDGHDSRGALNVSLLPGMGRFLTFRWILLDRPCSSRSRRTSRHEESSDLAKYHSVQCSRKIFILTLNTLTPLLTAVQKLFR